MAHRRRVRKVKGRETERLYEQGKTGGAEWLKKLFAHGMKFYILLTTSWATGLLLAPAILSLKNYEVVFVYSGGKRNDTRG